jgi:MFS transporter, PAT family, beta-lactamase induction signal transducer AmpG
MTDVALKLDAPLSLALSEHRMLRIATLFLLYVAQGLPLGFINFTLPGWLAQNGASAAAVGGVLAMANLPWTFKLAYGVVMDRYAFLAMGRRRPWIMVGQLGMVGTFAMIALMNPGVAEVALVTAFAFALGMGSAVQDVAVDGLAADVLPEKEIERVNGVMFGGQMTGIAIGTGLGGTLIAYQGVNARASASSRGWRATRPSATSISISARSGRSSATCSRRCRAARSCCCRPPLSSP